jgi:nicotinate phosphoribosyltransferase
MLSSPQSILNKLKSIEDVSFSPLLTDSYQISMTYTFWKLSQVDKSLNDITVFELYFRTSPFKGKYAIIGGIYDAIKFILNYKYTDDDIELLKSVYSNTYPNEFYIFLKTLNSSSLTVNAVLDGTPIFENEPFIQLVGNHMLCQLMETTLLNIIGHATLVTTLARRIRLVAPEQKLFEFGTRRAQGASAALTSAKYSFIGGFDGTSCVMASALYNIPIIGTHSHSFVMSCIGLEEIPSTLKLKNLLNPNEPCLDFKQVVLKVYNELNLVTNQSELASFIKYAWCNPTSFLALIDTYNTLASGLPNFCSVAIALIRLGYHPRGIRIDSGDLAYISDQIYTTFQKYGEVWPDFLSMSIVASNDLDENVIVSLNKLGSKIGAYGIGTKLATSSDQPSLGCVCKLVEINGVPRMKISESIEKTTLPAKKYVFRLFDKDGIAISDLMLTQPNIENVCPNNTIILINPKNPLEQVNITFSHYEKLLTCVIDSGILQIPIDNTISESRDRCERLIKGIRKDHTRLDLPTSYKVWVDNDFINLITGMFDK